jgi:hypothetical protein
MKNRSLIIFLVILIFKLSDTFAWRIEGPTVVCPGQTAEYIVYPETGLTGTACHIYADAEFKGARVTSRNYLSYVPLAFLTLSVTWPLNNVGIGKVSLYANTCSNVGLFESSGSIDVIVGKAPTLSLSNPGVCNTSESVTITASNQCNGLYNWEAPQGWVFTNNNSNIITNGPSVVTVKPLTTTNPLSVATVYATATNGSNVLSQRAQTTVSYYGSAIPAPVIVGPSGLCLTSPDQGYNIMTSDPSSTVNWSVSNSKARIVGYPNPNSVMLDIDNYATPGYFDLEVQLSNRCAAPVKVTRTISLAASIPGAPSTISGPATVCNSGGVSYYNIGYMASNVSYDIQPAAAVVSAVTGIYGMVEIDWNNSYTGPVQIKARLSNGCGIGPWSPVKTVNVINGTCTNRTSDGTDEYNFTSSEELAADLFPNPAEESATLLIGDYYGAEAQVKILDARGVEVFSRNNVSAGSVLTIGEELGSGVYFVKVSNGSMEKVLKFVKN